MEKEKVKKKCMAYQHLVLWRELTYPQSLLQRRKWVFDPFAGEE
jgi:hypothetical protein